MGISLKKKILFTQIKNFVKTSENSITILFDIHKAKTLFFRNTSDLEEFYGILQSVIENFAHPAQKNSPSEPLSSPRNSPISMEEDLQIRLDREILSYRGVKKQFKKGDVIVAEGDLYQRLYLVNQGSLEAVRNGEVVRQLPEGDTFGTISLLNLRPYAATITVTSETAEVTIIPGFKVNELINSDVDLAVRIFQKAGTVLQHQLEKFFAGKECAEIF